jgi:hypothetical protein
MKLHQDLVNPTGGVTEPAFCCTVNFDVEPVTINLSRGMFASGLSPLAPAFLWSIAMLPLMILFLPSTLDVLGVTALMVAVLPALASVIALTAIELMAWDTVPL